MPDVVMKNGWHMRRFDEMAVIVNDRIDDPSEADVDRYVGLEHLDSDSLTIRRWGSPNDVQATKLRFRTGDIIFGRRRAYQRKLAVADFDGICSAHAMVLRAKPEVVLPEFLPLLMQSDVFMGRATNISVGSLSPTINWRTLAKEQFALPPLEEQRRLAFAMWAAEMQRRAYSRLVDSSRLARRSLAASLFAITNYGPELQRLGVAVIHSAYGPRFAASEYADSGNARTIRTTDFSPNGGIDYSTVPSARLSEEIVADHRLLDGDFLLSRSGEYAGMVRVFDPSAAPDRHYIPAAFLIRLRLDRQRLLPRFLLEYCESVHGEVQLKRIAQGSAQPNISGSAFMNLRVPIPSLAEQEVVCKLLEQARGAESSARERLRGAERLSTTISVLLLNGGR